MEFRVATGSLVAAVFGWTQYCGCDEGGDEKVGGNTLFVVITKLVEFRRKNSSKFSRKIN